MVAADKLTKVGVFVANVVELYERLTRVIKAVVESVLVPLLDDTNRPDEMRACVVKDFEFHFPAPQIQ